jgi:hypothetical protein
MLLEEPAYLPLGGAVNPAVRDVRLPVEKELVFFD